MRVCCRCGRPMVRGYVVDAGAEYYCSKACLNHDWSDVEWKHECETNENSYYTEWDIVDINNEEADNVDLRRPMQDLDMYELAALIRFYATSITMNKQDWYNGDGGLSEAGFTRQEIVDFNKATIKEIKKALKLLKVL